MDPFLKRTRMSLNLRNPHARKLSLLPVRRPRMRATISVKNLQEAEQGTWANAQR